jgi:2,3-bisphosphoglycerate-independent phosphoglycerate mutase
MNQKAVLVILDGWGLAPAGPGNAISLANTPFVDELMASCPNSTLLTSGEDVGLPEGQMGNSEVGHLNIGAGRIVWQELANINKAIREKTIDSMPVLLNAFKIAKDKNVNLHFIGLVSDGGVHSHIEHLKKLCSMANDHELNKVFIHAFTDGRDTDPKGSLGYLTDLQNHLDNSTGKIATVTGRYYAMDRDKRWERVSIAYQAMVNGIGNLSNDWKIGLQNSYDENVTDEFITKKNVKNGSSKSNTIIETGKKSVKQTSNKGAEILVA